MKKLIAISLMLIFVAGIPGFTAAAHYCGDEMMESEWMLGPGELHCGMNTVVDHCEAPQQDKDLHPEDCCQNHYLTLEISDVFGLTAGVELPNLHFVAALTFVFAISAIQFIGVSTHTTPPEPTLTPPDLTVLYGVFRL